MSRVDDIKARVTEYRAALASEEPDAGMRATLAKIAIDSWAVGDLEYLLEEQQTTESALHDLKIRFMGAIVYCDSCKHKDTGVSEFPCYNCGTDNSNWEWDGKTTDVKGGST